MNRWPSFIVATSFLIAFIFISSLVNLILVKCIRWKNGIYTEQLQLGQLQGRIPACPFLPPSICFTKIISFGGVRLILTPKFPTLSANATFISLFTAENDLPQKQGIMDLRLCCWSQDMTKARFVRGDDIFLLDQLIMWLGEMSSRCPSSGLGKKQLQSKLSKNLNKLEQLLQFILNWSTNFSG